MYPNIILLGHINSGKTTCADYLAKKYNYNKYSLGDSVKTFIVDLYKILNLLDSNINPININDLYNRDTKELYRKHMQLISTDLIRNYFGDDVWINYLIKNIDKKPFVIDDVRFKNEYEIFNTFNVISIRIIRNNEIKNEHISETNLNDIKTDYTIINDNDLNKLYNKIDIIMKLNKK